MVMSGPVVPSGSDFDAGRDLGGSARHGRLGRLLDKVLPGTRRPPTVPAQVQDGVGETMRVSSTTLKFDSSRSDVSPQKAKLVAPEVGPPVGGDMAGPRRPKPRKRLVLSDELAVAEADVAAEEKPYNGTWDHGRGSQRNARDTIDSARSLDWYND